MSSFGWSETEWVPCVVLADISGFAFSLNEGWTRYLQKILLSVEDFLILVKICSALGSLTNTSSSSRYVVHWVV